MKVQERAATESESIYCTLYGTLDDADDDESQGVYENPNNPIHPPKPTPESTYEPSSMFAASVGLVPPLSLSQPTVYSLSFNVCAQCLPNVCHTPLSLRLTVL